MKQEESFSNEPRAKTHEEMASNLGFDLLERGETDKIAKKSQKQKAEEIDKKGGKKHRIERIIRPHDEKGVIETQLLEPNIIESNITNPKKEEKSLKDELFDLEKLAAKLLQQGNLSRRRSILDEIKRIREEIEKSTEIPSIGKSEREAA